MILNNLGDTVSINMTPVFSFIMSKYAVLPSLIMLYQIKKRLSTYLLVKLRKERMFDWHHLIKTTTKMTLCLFMLPQKTSADIAIRKEGTNQIKP
jgi:hypothetical protein